MQIPNYSGLPIITTQRLGEFDFSNFFDKAVTGLTTIYAAKTTYDASKDAAKRQYELEMARIKSNQGNMLMPDFGGGSGYIPAPFMPTSSGSLPVMPLLIIGGLGIAAFLLVRK